jgi:choice-of-anchor B domain-containing protein
MQVYERLKIAKPVTIYDNGFVVDHTCEKMDLLAHIPLYSFSINPSAANDVWGFYDANDGREYAIMGLRNGVGIVEVTDPESPRMVGSISSQSTSWRDIKVYQHFNLESARWDSYAYVTADSVSVGTMIIDLRSLPETISVAGSDSSDISAHNVYLSNVDYSLGVALNDVDPYLHIASSNRKGGSFNTYSLDNPRSPV